MLIWITPDIASDSVQKACKRATCEGKDGAVRPGAREEICHVPTPGVRKDGGCTQVVGHCACAHTELLAHSAIWGLCQLRQEDRAMLLIPAPYSSCQTILASQTHAHCPFVVVRMQHAWELVVSKWSCRTVCSEHNGMMKRTL